MLFRRLLPALAVALGSSVARAEPELYVELHYQPDAGLDCPSEAAFKVTVSDQLGYDPFRLDAEQKVVARTRPSERGLRGVIEWYDASGNPRGERELGSESSDCAALARAMAFAVAVQIQLLAQEAENNAVVSEQPSDGDSSETIGASSPPVPAPSPPSDAPRSSPLRPSQSRAPRHFLLGVGPTLAFGLAPRTVVEGRAFGGLRRGGLGIELGIEASLPSRHETEDGNGFEQRVLVGSLAGCGFFAKLSGCLVSKVGRLHVRGFGVDVPNSDAGTLLQLGPRLALIEGFGESWFGALRVEALVSLVTWEVTLNQAEVWKTPLFSLSVGGDLGLLLQ